MDEADSGGPERAAALLADLERFAQAKCGACGRPLCGHHVLLSVAMGARDAPRCLACLASALAAERDAFRDELFAYVQHRECYRVAWAEAGRREGLGPETRPGCLWPADRVGGAGAAGAGNAKAQGPLDASPSRREDAAWDAGELGCGDLVLELRQRLSGMDPGRILRVTARDSGAPEDLPAWCRLTGHILLAATHPDYWIQRRGK